MFTHFLVPTDGSPLSAKAAQAAVELAQKTGARITVLSVAEPYPYSALGEGAFLPDQPEYEAKMRELAQRAVEAAAALARAANVSCETRIADGFSPSEEIVRLAGALGCDAIFMASHGRKGLNRLFVGSETQKVLAHTNLPVMVFR
jgi:nucleotide-binding universal stress UspA family protein